MNVRTSIRILVASVVLSASLCARGSDSTMAPAPPTAEEATFFESKIRPIFVDNCYKCHSVEKGESKGGLTLDTRDGWKKGGGSGPAIEPGSPDKSLLIDAVSYKEPGSPQMPPKPNKKLTADQIAALRQWVKMGAPDPRVGSGGKLSGMNDAARAHWAYQPIKPQAVPSVAKQVYVANPVDSFIVAKLESSGLLAKLESAGLANKPASREVLLRRATYDLTGLPPTPEDIHAFEVDRAPTVKAFEKVVERLLASPHYGERWGRYWLDTARYADTSGSDVKTDDHRYVYAWGYRDYVIKAFNQDLPYDKFLMEQIAADLLPDAEHKTDSFAALGFLTVGKRFSNNHDTIDERIDTVTKATQGITVSCARCHDHKFDPIPTADYYSLHGIFASIEEPTARPTVGRSAASTQAADYEKTRAVIENGNRKIYFDYVSDLVSDFDRKAAGYILSSLYSNGKYRDPIKKKQAIDEFSLITSANEQRLNMARVTNGGSPVFMPLMWFAELPAETFSDRANEVLNRIRQGGESKKLNPLVVNAFAGVSAGSLRNVHDVAMVYGKLFSSLGDKAQKYIRANRTATTSNVAGFDEPIRELLKVPLAAEPAPALTTEHLKAVLNQLFLGEQAYNKFLFADLNDLELTHPGAPLRAMIVRDKAVAKDSPIFKRGDASKPDKIAPRQFLQILSGPDRKPFTIGSGRLELAQAIANKKNPLTARVMINRIWMHHFGEGFVHTPDNIGVPPKDANHPDAASPTLLPSHPELLDYLAGRFMDEGWSVKKMHKLIMLSKTYQKSGETNAECAKIDPGNRLLWRANLRRLDFEATRDSLIQFTGRLDPTVGGKPVNITEEPYSYRRSVYGFVDRGNLPELLTQFDYSDPNRPNSSRTSTIVPPQALFFMNSTLSADVARKVCSRSEFLHAANDVQRVAAIYKVLYQRKPHDAEVRLAAIFYKIHIGLPAPKASGSTTPALAKRKSYDADQLKGGSDNRGLQNDGAMVDRRPLNVWEEYAQSLLMTNELVYVQ